MRIASICNRFPELGGDHVAVSRGQLGKNARARAESRRLRPLRRVGPSFSHLPMFPPKHLFGEQMMPSLVRCADDFGRHTSSNASKSKIKWPQEAVKEVHGWLKKGLRVVDADLSGYFDTIPHGQLMKSLGWRINDGESPVPSRRC